MASWEIPFESASIAYETTRNTAVSPPTHRIPLAGSVAPVDAWSDPEEQRGELAGLHRSVKVGETATFDFSGDLDNQFMPFLMQMHVKGSITPTTPAGGTNTRLWTGTADMTSDTLKSGTIYYGDPGTGAGQLVQCPFAMSRNLVITADAMSENAVQIQWQGIANAPAVVSTPSLPASAASVSLVPRWLQLWVDTSSAHGTTEITGRVYGVQGTFPNVVEPKPTTGAPGANTLGYSRVGRGKTVPEMTATFEMVDFTQYNQWKNSTLVKVRARISGALIEGSLYHYIEWDMTGYWRAPTWGELASTNRTMTLTLRGQKDDTLGAHYVLRAQNTKTAV